VSLTDLALVVEASGRYSFRHLVMMREVFDGAALILDAGAHDVLEQHRRAADEGLVPPGAGVATGVDAAE